MKGLDQEGELRIIKMLLLFHDLDLYDEGEEKFILLEQAAAYLLVDHQHHRRIYVLDPLLQVG